MYVQCLKRQGKDIGFSRIGVTDNCEQPGGCWESNPGLLEEQLVLLTTESSFQLVCVCVLIIFLKNHVCVYVEHVCAIACKWRSEDNF